MNKRMIMVINFILIEKRLSVGIEVMDREDVDEVVIR